MKRPVGARFLVLAAYLMAAAASGWMDEYAQESMAADKTCGARQFDDCRGHLLRLRALLDGRADIAYRLAKVEAAMGNRQGALDWLTAFSKSGLTFANPAVEPEFAALRNDEAFRVALSRITTAKQPVTQSKTFCKLANPS